MSQSKLANSKPKLFHRLILVVFAAYLATLALLYFGNFKISPDMPRELWGIPMDKIAHFLMFLPYPFLAHRSLTGKRKWRNLVFVILSGIVLAYCLELTQHTVNPLRTSDPWDLLTNIASITVASFILSLVDLIRK